MRRNSVKLSAPHKVWLYGAMLALYVTGAAWAWLHYFGDGANEFGSRPAAEPWLMKLHGAGAMVFLVLLGTLLPSHVRFAWHAHRNRVNGVALIASLVFLIASGYGLYYFGDERWRSWTSWSHLATGLALPAMIILHIWSGRRSAPQRRNSKATMPPQL